MGKLEDIDEEKFKQLYVVECRKRSEVAQILGVKPYVVSNFAKKCGLNKPSMQSRIEDLKKKVSKEQLENLYSKFSYTEILSRLGITGDYLDALLREYGLGKRSKTKRIFEKFSEDDVRRLYLEENKTIGELAEIFQIKVSTVFKILRRYGITKSDDLIAQNIQKTVRERYGVGNIRQSESFKQHMREVKLSKYGTETYNNRKQANETCLGRYGAEYPLQSEEVKQKVVQHRWIDKSSEELEMIQKKIEKTNLGRYGVLYPILSADMNPQFSKPNQKFAALLERNSIDYSREFLIGRRPYDFKVKDILIEINPFATHNSTWGIKNGSGKSSDYHWNKSHLALDHGFRCIHVWDWDDQEKILNLLLPKKALYARKLELKKQGQRETNHFLEKYHLQGRAIGQIECYGLYQGGELIQVMTFGKPRFNKNYEWELIRLCTKAGYLVVGGAERLFKAFVREHSPNSIISYCDNAKFSGQVYVRLGMNLQSEGGPTKHWYSPELNMHITDNGLRMKGFDKLFGDIFGCYGKGSSNEQLMRDHGFVEIYDVGQSVYVWENKK